MASLSSAEVECCTLHHGIMNLTWLKILTNELDFGPTQSMTLLYDNTTTIVIANNSVQHD